MSLFSTYQSSGGFLLDKDGRLVVMVDNSGGPGSGLAGGVNGATPLHASSGNVAAATASATLTGAASATTYLTGFEITASGATAASVVTATVTGILGGTLSYTFAAPAGVTTAATPLMVEFNTAVPASATNTNIVVSLPSLGSGNTNATVVAHGFRI